jgi:geranylgeranyl transferase type-2 subunit alpha
MRYEWISIFTDGAWFHRQWIIDRLNFDVQNELILCQNFLASDQRNFHCWNYRRYIISTSDIDKREEFSYSMQKIIENFSNYSAFHHRSVLLKSLQISPRDVLESELSIVENAVYTEPGRQYIMIIVEFESSLISFFFFFFIFTHDIDDQSAWWYHQFLFTWAFENVKGDDVDWLHDVLLRQIQIMRELSSIENESKWTLLTLAALILRYIKLKSGQILTVEHTEELNIMRNERIDILNILCELDAIHKNRYIFLISNT